MSRYQFSTLLNIENDVAIVLDHIPFGEKAYNPDSVVYPQAPSSQRAGQLLMAIDALSHPSTAVGC